MEYKYSITDSKVLLRESYAPLKWEAYNPKTGAWAEPDVRLGFILDSKCISSEEAQLIIATRACKPHIPPQYHMRMAG